MANKFNKYIQDQEYDSDALRDDLMDCDENGKGSNIAEHMANKAFVDIIREYQRNNFNDTTKTSSILDTGITWYYWKYYKNFVGKKNKRDTQIKLKDYQNINQHLGYSYSDLYVKQKYLSFKTEILTHISIADYNDLVLLKAQKYKATELCKTIWANDHSDNFLHYNIKKGTNITMGHLMSIILYCDFPKFTKRLISTFNRKTKYESLYSIKERNRDFWWQSRILREAVEIFGHCNRRYYYIGDGWNSFHTWRRTEVGPFYCGYTCSSDNNIVPGFSFRICAPLSTSKSMEVAINFMNIDNIDNDEEGIMIALNNNGHTWSKMLTMFDCSWISKYKSESERVLIGGFEKISIESIRTWNIDVWINHEKYFHALYLFDNMINGQSLFESDMKMTYNDVDIIKKMLTLSYRDIESEYIVECWKHILIRKQR